MAQHNGLRVKSKLPSAMALSFSSPPSRSQMCDSVVCHLSDESGFGGWVDDKVRIVHEAVSLLSQKKFHPQHLTISL